MYIGYPAGGGYDAYSRTVARHMGGHIPGNPNFTPKNRPGAGTIKLSNEVFNTLAQDGTVLAMIDHDLLARALVEQNPDDNCKTPTKLGIRPGKRGLFRALAAEARRITGFGCPRPAQ